MVLSKTLIHSSWSLSSGFDLEQKALTAIRSAAVKFGIDFNQLDY